MTTATDQVREVVVTPLQVERRLLELSREIDAAHRDLEAAEHGYAKAKSEYEIAAAGARLRLAREWAAAGIKATVQEKDDHALAETRTEYLAMNAAEAVVRASRANVARLRVQVDIARSLGTSVRTGWDT